MNNKTFQRMLDGDLGNLYKDLAFFTSHHK